MKITALERTGLPKRMPVTN